MAKRASSPAWLRRYDALAAQRIRAFRRAVLRIVRDRLEPLSFESVTEWAEANRYLPPTASEPGRYDPDRCPYQRGIQDAFNMAGVREISVQAAERIGKTCVACNILGYVIDRRPMGVLWTMPSRDAVEDVVRDEVRPMIRQSARLRRKVAARGSRDGGTVRRIAFQGGQVSFQGGGSSLQLAFRTVRLVINDETDKLKNLPGEGDADALLAKRVSTFGDEGIILRFSKPTTEDRFVRANAWRRLKGVRGLGIDKRKSRGASGAIIRNEYTDKTFSCAHPQSRCRFNASAPLRIKADQVAAHLERVKQGPARPMQRPRTNQFHGY